MRCLGEFLERRLEFTEAFFADLRRAVLFVQHNDATFDGWDVTFTIRRSDRLILLSVGCMEVFAITNEMSALRFLSHLAAPDARHFTNRLAAQLTPSKMVGDYLVYGYNGRLATVIGRLEASDRFIVFAFAAIMQAVVETAVLAIASENTNAVEFATALKDRAMTVPNPENASVLVIDLAETDRSEPFQLPRFPYD
jgi:hypothetical protein